MASSAEFDPDWVLPPGETVQECMDDRGMTPGVFAVACGMMDVDTLEQIIAGEAEITDTIAAQLAVGTGISTGFWLNMERTYREGLAAGKRRL